jgi:hypothetical protein
MLISLFFYKKQPLPWFSNATYHLIRRPSSKLRAMKTSPFWPVALVLFAAFVLPTHARTMFSRITPSSLVSGDLKFAIEAQRERYDRGIVSFDVVVTSQGKTLLKDTDQVHIGASLSIIIQTARSFSGTHIAEINITEKTEQRLRFRFPMPEKSLSDPTLALQLNFGFGRMASADCYYAMLKDFVPPVTPEPAEPNPYLWMLAGQTAVVISGVACFWLIRRNRWGKP